MIYSDVYRIAEAAANSRSDLYTKKYRLRDVLVEFCIQNVEVFGLKRVFMVMLLFLTFAVPVLAATEFLEDARFDPKQSYSWSGSGSDKYVDFSKGEYKYRVYDRGTMWEPSVMSGDGRSFMCDPINTTDGCMMIPNGTPVAKNQVNFPGGFVFVFGHYDVTPDPLPKVDISPDSGEFVDSIEVVVSGSSGSTLYYSLDGSEPSIPYTGRIQVSETTTVKAKAVSPSGSSEVVSKTYTKKTVHLTLMITPDNTILDKPIEVSLIPSEPDAIVYYSLDDSEPSIRYTGPITIDRPLTLKAKAVKGSRSSPVYQKVYKKPPIMHTDDKYFMVPVDLPAVTKGAIDYVSVISPGIWMFAVVFFGLLILAVARKVFKR